jgi:hypothetical protein
MMMMMIIIIMIIITTGTITELNPWVKPYLKRQEIKKVSAVLNRGLTLVLLMWRIG